MHNATLTVNLAALKANYQLLKNRHVKKNIAAVVKANAYGLGVEAVSKAIWQEGCELFFVATLDEAIQLRGYLPTTKIAVFNGIFKGEEKEFSAHNIIPVANDAGQFERIQDSEFRIQDYFIHVDTGMTRLGCNIEEVKKLAPRILNPESRILLISHLACANDATHLKNAEQLRRLKEAQKLLPNIPVSFANSSGHFLSSEFHFDIGRPGCALYGINPTMGENPMQHVATLSAPLLQIRTLDRDEAVGYGASYSAPKGSRIAIAGMGYADGMFRSLSNKGFAYVAGVKVPFAGRVSMDMIALDISAIPEQKLNQNLRAEFINAQQTVDDIARECDTIGYEIFTRLGRRIVREYT